MKERSILLIDGFSLFYKSFFAFQYRPLINSKNIETSVFFNFFNVLHTLYNYKSFSHIAVALESKSPTLRKQKFSQYKAHRPPMDESLKKQINTFLEHIEYFGIPVLQQEGLEADDLLASAAIQAEKNNLKTYIYTSDKDLMQIINDNIVLINTNQKSEIEITDEKKVQEKWEVLPKQILDFLSILGDTADNIPGIKGIGKKGASKLLNQFGNLETIYKKINEISSKNIQDKLINDKENAFLSKNLITLITDTPISIENLVLKKVNKDKLLHVLKEFELNSIIKKYKIEQNQSMTIKIDDYKLIKTNNSIPIETEIKSEEKHQKLPSFNRHIIENIDDLKKLCMDIKQKKHMIFDLETSSIDPHHAKLICITLTFKNDFNSYFIPLISEVPETAHTHDLMNLSNENRSLVKDFSTKNSKIFLSLLKNIFEDENIKKIGHNLKYEYSVLKCHNVELKNIHHDTMIVEYLIDSSKTHYNLEKLVLHYFKINKKTYKETFLDSSLYDVDQSLLIHYALDDAETTQAIYQAQIPLITKNIKSVLNEIELPLIQVIAHMELHGVIIDDQHLKKLEDKLLKEVKIYEQSIYTLSGENFNINSTKQLQEVLFEKLNITPIKKTKTGYSTDMDVLIKLSETYPISKIIVKYRIINKLLSTYIKALPKLINPKTHKIHTSYNQSVASTGRLSSSYPNLQNIPIKTEEGREIRKAFIAPHGYSLVSFDYSQVELRVLAYLSQDKNLLNAFTQNQDIHSNTAKIIFNTPSPTNDERRIGKTINFSVIYGISPFSLGNDLKVTASEAKYFIDSYFNAYPSVRKYIDFIIEKTKEIQYVETYYGRKRPFPMINFGNKIQQEKIKRMAFNTVIQGTSSDIIKKSMINIHESIQNNVINAIMVMQVHDELIFYIKDDTVQDQIPIIKTFMADIEPFNNLLKIDHSVEKFWSK